MADAFALHIELLDDAVFSERPASAGAHAGLDHVPGSALLGWAASRLYRELDVRDAWLLFHSGKVRFSDGVPLAENGLPAWPAPLSLHAKKGERWREHGRALSGRLLNLVRAGRPEGEQLRQLRGVRFTHDGRVHEPDRELTMKTAIDPDTGRAASSQLYGYEALRAGQRFVARIEADDDVPGDLLARLRSLFDGDVVHLGRSRGAQYGRAACAVVGEAPAPAGIPGASREITLWLLADMAVARDGQPLLAPGPRDIGLPEGRFVPEKSFIRARRYAPFNAHRRTHDVERQVIAAGSVLVFEMDESVDPATLPRAFGLWREAGLGRVAVNPAMLEGEHPRFEEAVESTPVAAPTRPDSPLLDWLEEIRVRADLAREIDEKVEAMARELLDHLYPGVVRLGAAGVAPPGKTQWGRLRELASAASDGGRLMSALFEGDGPLKKENNDDWNAVTADGQGNVTTLREWLKARLDAERADARPLLVVRLARRMADELQSMASGEIGR